MNDVIWNYAPAWESVAAAMPDQPAIVQGDDAWAWSRVDAEADALAAGLIGAGLQQQSKVAVYMTNRPEFLVSYFAAFKAGLVPLNINYRYTSSELAYLLDNADAEAVVFHVQYASVIEDIRDQFGAVKIWVAVGSDGNCPDWATPWEQVTGETPGERPYRAPWGHDPEDFMMIYTGGTTGMPKGVMWRLADLIGRSNYMANPLLGTDPLESPEDAGERAKASPIKSRSLIAPPLMHATGLISGFGAFSQGGLVILLPDGKFSAEMLLDAAEKHKATRLTIVGEPFAGPILEALDDHPGRWDLSSLLAIGSSGAMWTRETKLGLIKHIPQVNLMDSYASSEAMGMGISTMNAQSEGKTAHFEISPTCAVFSEDGRRIEPGSDEAGMLAVGGFNPVGYYKDEEKTAKTFPVIEGERWCMPGDWAKVLEDGSLEILGRGSQCINTGGEKVFPEEVEEALRRHQAVRDVAVTGLPDPKWGERVCAVVELSPRASNPGEAELTAFVREQLADYKCPRDFVFVETVGRAPNGKLDYKAIKAVATKAMESAAA